MLRVNTSIIDPAIVECIQSMKESLLGMEKYVDSVMAELQKPVSIIVPDTTSEEERLSLAKETLPVGGLVIVQETV